MAQGETVADVALGPRLDGLAQVMLEAATLKWVPRVGWQMRGVPNAESVAEHSFGVAFTALLLAEELTAGNDAKLKLDLARILLMALLHDLAEIRLSDLPASAARLLSDAVKSQAEEAAIHNLLRPLTRAGHLYTVWHEFELASSAEGRLVRDADKLEMMVQCLCYEQAGCRGLDEFWQATDMYPWHYALSAELYQRLRQLRPGASPGVGA